MSTQYLNFTVPQMAAFADKGLCAWSGSTVTDEGCLCRFCDSCSEYWLSTERREHDEGRPLKELCPDCKEAE